MNAGTSFPEHEVSKMGSSGGRKLAEQLNVSWLRNAGLCMGCGTCEAVCPVRAIEVRREGRKGIYLPDVDSDRCTQCGLCVKVCPGVSVDFDQLANKFLDGKYKDDRIGVFEACYTGCSSVHNIRYNSSSGGLVTSLLIYALEKGLIEGALVLGMSESNPPETEPSIATTPSEIIAASGSKYCPSAINKGLCWILENDGRFAVVGLPCHIQAVRKLELLHTGLRKKIVLHLGIFCANNNTYLGTEYFLRNNRIPPNRVRDIRYRAEGWPGKIRITLADDVQTVIPRATTESKWYRKALFASAFHYDFMIPRCLLCVDQTCELADIALGDPWLSEYKRSERVGRSFVIVRNQLGHAFLEGAVAARAVHIENMTLSDARRAQNYTFKGTAGSRILLRRLFGFATPDYGRRRLSVTTRGVLSAFRYLPSYVSHNRWVWPFIRLLAVAHYLERDVVRRFKSVARFCLRGLRLGKVLGRNG